MGTLAVVVAVLIATTGSSDVGGTPFVSQADPDPPLPPAGGRNAFTARITSATVGPPIRPGFLGFSFEFQAVRSYTGTDPQRINPVLVQLIRNLSPGQAPVLRIGGDSTDVCLRARAGGRRAPVHRLSAHPELDGDHRGARPRARCAHDHGAQPGREPPALAAAEVRAYMHTIGRSAIEALEIGNEPNVYDKLAGYKSPQGGSFDVRGPGFGYPSFLSEFQAVAATAPASTLAGPALAVGPTAGPGSWVNTLPDFLSQEQRVQIMTVHRYPLRNCFVPPSSPQYPTVSHLLAGYATAGLAASLRRWIAIAHAQHRQIRVDELNSVACRGKAGVSDTFASSLWVVDALFELARAGVDGVNMHTLPDSAYKLFEFSRSHGRWRARVEPVYYGLQLFAQAAPPGSRLLAVRGVKSSTRISVWATRAPDRRVRVALVNEDPSRTRTVTITRPAGMAGAPTLERMQGPSVHAKRDITLGARTYGAQTYSGILAQPRTQPLAATRAGAYRISLPHGSAALLTFSP